MDVLVRSVARGWLSWTAQESLSACVSTNYEPCDPSLTWRRNWRESYTIEKRRWLLVGANYVCTKLNIPSEEYGFWAHPVFSSQAYLQPSIDSPNCVYAAALELHSNFRKGTRSWSISVVCTISWVICTVAHARESWSWTQISKGESDEESDSIDIRINRVACKYRTVVVRWCVSWFSIMTSIYIGWFCTSGNMT